MDYFTLFYWFTFISLLFSGIIILIYNFKNKINLNLFWFIINIVFWMLSIYFWYFFINPESLFLSTFFIRLTFFFWIFASFFLSSFIYYYPKEDFKFSNKFKIAFLFLTIFTAIISWFTDLVYEKEIIVNWNEIQDIHWPLHIFFILNYLFNLFLALWIWFKKIWKTIWVEKNKIIVAIIAISSVVFSWLIFHTILPIFNIYWLQTEVVTFNLVFVVLVFYSMVNYRFLNISDIFLKFFRNLLLFSFAILWFYFSNFILDLFLNHFLDENISDLISIIFSIYIFKKLNEVFPNLLKTSVDLLRIEALYLKWTLSYSNNFPIFFKILEKSFIKKLDYSSLNIFVFRNKDCDLKVPYLIKDDFYRILKQNKKNILVYEEIDYLEFSENQKVILKKWMEDIKAKILLPLFSMNNLIWIFILWDKNNQASFSVQDVNIFQDLRDNLDFSFMNVLLKERLEEENDLMKKIINKKTETLQEQNEQVSKLLKQQSDFIAVAAHEFRTPLSIALFQLEDTLETYKNDPEISEEMNIIQDSLEKLNILTKNLFDTQKYDLEKIQIKKEKVDVIAFLKIISFECKKISQDKWRNISLENFDLKELFYEFDEWKIRQVILNLITNSIKFTPENWKILISGFKENDKICFSVEDNWEWIPEDKRDFVFYKFKTNHLEKSKWIGLWLYLSKKIIELHWWKIWIEDSKKLWWAKIIFCL